MEEEERCLTSLIAKYRSMHLIIQRAYQDKEVRAFVLGLAYWLRIAVMQGYAEVEDIATVLSICEPLEQVGSLHKLYLHIAYLVYVKRDPGTALHVAEDTRWLYPEDERLTRMVKQLRNVQSGKNRGNR